MRRHSPTHVEPGVGRLCGLVLFLLAGLGAACRTGERTGPRESVSIDALVSDFEAGRIAEGSRVRATGVVTDDDPHRQLAFVADTARGLAIRTGPAGLTVAAGRRVTVEGTIGRCAFGPCLTDAVVVDSGAGSLDRTRVYDPPFDRRLPGRPVEIEARIEAASMRDGRLLLSLVLGKVRLQAEVRDPAGLEPAALVGAVAHARGVVEPLESGRSEFPGRIVVAGAAGLTVVRPPTGARRGPPLSSAAAIHALPSDVAAAGHPVQIRGQVIDVPTWRGLFLQTDGHGIHIDYVSTLDHPIPRVRPGDVIDITGQTGAGRFAPVIEARRLQVVGHAPLPPGRAVNIDDLVSGREDSQLIDMVGTVRAVRRAAAPVRDYLELDLAHGGERMPTYVPWPASAPMPPGLGVDAAIRVRAVAATLYNNYRQTFGARLLVPTADDVRILSPAPADPFALPLSSTDRLLDFAGTKRGLGRLRKVQGVVVLSVDGSVFLRDTVGMLEIRAAGDPLRAAGEWLRSGDQIEAVGFPSASKLSSQSALSPRLDDALIRRLGRAPLPQPTEASALELLRGSRHATLVRVRGRLLQHVATAHEDLLVLDGGGAPFSAHLARTAGLPSLPPLQNGSLLELIGVTSMQETARQGGGALRSFRLLLPSAEAVVVREPAPWMTAARLLWILGALAIATGVSLSWVWTLRRRVQAQTRQLVAARNAAEAASQSKSEFVAHISHEIRTPMNGVLGVTELMLETTHEPEARQYLGMVKSSAEALLRIINDLLDFSKIEAGKMELSPRPFRVRELLGETVAVLTLPARAKGLDLVWHVAPDVPDALVADAERLRQVVLNLAGNAVKFTERGHVTVDVTLAEPMAAGASHGQVRIAVRDTGIGIPEDRQAAVFEAFSQAEHATSRKYGGTGLGLAISARIVEMMGGRLELASQVGVGSTFHFTMAMALDAAASAAAVVVPEQPAPPIARVHLAVAPVEPLRLLVAEDNPVNQKLAIALLTRRGHRPVAVDNGSDAVEAWKRERFDAIFMDVQMPEMDGFEATAAIREAERESGGHIPIVAMTAHAMQGDRDRCLDAGMDHYLSKPISIREVDRVLELLAARRAA